MAKFDPDKFLSETAGAKKSEVSFDPDKFLSETTPSEKSGIPGEGYIRGALQALPVAGAVAGGVVGTALGPAGTFGGAGLGAAAGKALENFGEKMLGDEKTYEQAVIDPVIAGAEGVTAEMGGQAITPIISKGASLVGSKAGDIAKSFSARALGAERGTVKKLGIDKTKEIGAYGLENKLFGPFSSADEMVAKNQAVKDKAGKGMQQVFDKIDEAGASTFNPPEVAKKMIDDMGDFWRSPLNKSEASQFDDTIEAVLLRGNENITLKEAQKLKKEIDKVAYPKGQKPLQPTPRQEIAADASFIVKDKIDEAVTKGAEKIGSEELNSGLAESRKLYGNAKGADKFLENKVAREAGNQVFGLTDNIRSGVGASIGAAAAGPPGAAVGGIGAGLASKFGGKYLPQNIALASNNISKILTQTPEVAQFAKANPAAFQAMVLNLAPQFEAGVIQNLPKAAENQPTKGPEKWVSTGANKLNQAGISQDIIDSLRQSKQGRDLLIEASDASPGSKRMESVLKRIRTANQGGQ